MTNAKNLFIIETEYHLMATLSVIYQSNSGLVGQKNVVLAIQDPNRRRLPSIDGDEFGFTYYEVRANQGELGSYKGMNSVIKDLLLQEYLNCFLFLEHLPLERYIAITLSKKGSRVCLLPDGTKPYLELSHVDLKSRIKRTLKNYSWLFLNSIWPGKPSLIPKSYASSGFLDEVWLTHKNCYKGKKNIQIHQFNLLDSVESLGMINRFYESQLLNLNIPTEGIILYVNNIYHNEKAESFEVEVLSNICDATLKPVFVKLHPYTSKGHRINIAGIAGIRLIDELIPVELLIKNLKDSLILSFWSAGLLIDNQDCRFYWLHQLMSCSGLLPDGFKICNPTKHINEVCNFDYFMKNVICC